MYLVIELTFSNSSHISSRERVREREIVLKDERKDINLFKVRIVQTLLALFKSYI